MEALPAGFVPQGAGDSGRIAIRFGIDDSLRANWDGVLSLDFSDADSSWTDYFYRLSPDGLVLARAVMDPAMNRATEVDQTAGTVAFPIYRWTILRYPLMAFVQFTDVCLAFGARDLLKSASLYLAAGTRAALAGSERGRQVHPP